MNYVINVFITILAVFLEKFSNFFKSTKKNQKYDNKFIIKNCCNVKKLHLIKKKK